MIFLSQNLTNNYTAIVIPADLAEDHAKSLLELGNMRRQFKSLYNEVEDAKETTTNMLLYVCDFADGVVYLPAEYDMNNIIKKIKKSAPSSSEDGSTSSDNASGNGATTSRNRNCVTPIRPSTP